MESCVLLTIQTEKSLWHIFLNLNKGQNYRFRDPVDHKFKLSVSTTKLTKYLFFLFSLSKHNSCQF